MAPHYPDAHDGSIAHVAKLRQLEAQGAAQWLTTYQLPQKCKPVGTTMTYIYNLNFDGTVQ